jgi:hypothetical protein
MAVKYSDFGNPHGFRHGMIVIENMDNSGNKRARQAIQVPLDYYRARKYITNEQFSAGDELFKDFYRAGVSQKVVMDLNEVSRIPNHAMSNHQVEALERFREAMNQLEIEGRKIAWDVCCMGYRIEDIGLKKGYGIQRLQSVLDTLAVHYGFAR